MMIFLLFLNLSPRLEQPLVSLMMIPRVFEDQRRLRYPSVEKLIIKVWPIMPLGCSMVVTLSLDLLGMRIVRRGPS
jgi:hypothetical protein